MKNIAAGRSKRILFNVPKDHQIKINAAIIFKVPLSLFTCIPLSYLKFINFALLLLPKNNVFVWQNLLLKPMIFFKKENTKPNHQNTDPNDNGIAIRGLVFRHIKIHAIPTGN